MKIDPKLQAAMDAASAMLLRRLVTEGRPPRGILIVCVNNDAVLSTNVVVRQQDPAFVNAFFTDVAEYAEAAAAHALDRENTRRN